MYNQCNTANRSYSGGGRALVVLDGVQTELQVPLVFVGEGHSLVITGLERFAQSIQNMRMLCTR